MAIVEIDAAGAPRAETEKWLPRGLHSGRDRIYFPHLDGMRFFAYALVLIHHFYNPADYFRQSPVTLSIVEPLFYFGWIGVDIFLVLSSFLIFSLLLAERRRTGKISIAAFFIRRAMRIWPLYFPYLIFAMVILPLVWNDNWPAPYEVTLSQQLFPYLIFLGNFSSIQFFTSVSSMIAHLWTVCLEEQFYVFPPILLAFFALRLNRRFLAAALALLAFTMSYRLYVLANGIPYPTVWLHPLCRMDPFIVGAVAAVLVERRPDWLQQRRTGYCLCAAGIVGLGLVAVFPHIGSSLHTVWQLSIVALGAGCLVVAPFAWSAPARALSVRPLPFLGKITFGLYVYHVLALRLFLPVFSTKQFLGATSLSYVLDLVIALLVNIAIAAASYLLYESRILKLKAKFEIVSSRPV